MATPLQRCRPAQAHPRSASGQLHLPTRQTGRPGGAHPPRAIGLCSGVFSLCLRNTKSQRSVHPTSPWPQPIPFPRARPTDNWTVLTGLWPPRSSATPLYKPHESSCRAGKLSGNRAHVFMHQPNYTEEASAGRCSLSSFELHLWLVLSSAALVLPKHWHFSKQTSDSLQDFPLLFYWFCPVFSCYHWTIAIASK